MGHQLPRAALAAALTIAAAACAGGDRADGPPAVLDNAREVVAASSDPLEEPEPIDEAPDELPPPDPSTFQGALRVVNLWVGGAGSTTSIDVWVRRSFTAGPLLLAEGIDFGSATPYLAVPPGGDVVVVTAGAGPDAVARAELTPAGAGEQLTSVFTNREPDGGVDVANVFERGDDRAPAPPADDHGLVLVRGANLRAFSDDLVPALGADRFHVGDGAANCRVQRIEAAGFPPETVGGTRAVELELPAGPATISLHPRTPAGGCEQPPDLSLILDVEPGSVTLVLVVTRDGGSLEAVTLPIAAVS